MVRRRQAERLPTFNADAQAKELVELLFRAARAFVEAAEGRPDSEPSPSSGVIEAFRRRLLATVPPSAEEPARRRKAVRPIEEPATNDDDALAPGVTFDGRYTIIAKIGEGGFGAVYKARQRATGQWVALKMIRAAEGGDARQGTRVARFLREAEICAELQHPHIVHLVDAGKTRDGRLYTVFAFVPGDNLADVLMKEGALSPREARHLMLQLLDALACAHAKGVVHRDFKPSNIMIIPTGARRNALLLDLGIGAMLGEKPHRARQRLTASRDLIGTPGYGAPEQWRGSLPSPRADLFAWGLVFLECLTGKPVYGEGTAAECFYRQLGPDPVPIPAMLKDHPLGALLIRATRKDVTERDVTARGLLEALEACDVTDLSRAQLLGDANGAGAGAVTLIAAGPEKKSKNRGARVGRPSSRKEAERSVSAGKRDGQRRLLTAVCCQVMAMSAADHAGQEIDALDDIVRAHFVRLGDIAQRHRGHVAAALGDQLLLYFGYPHAAENDVASAARTALDIVEDTRTQAAELARGGVRLEVRLSIHTGFTAATANDVDERSLSVGATPRAASRLAREAKAGTVLVTAASRELLQASFDFAAAGTRTSGGSSTPLDIFQLLSPRDHVPGAAPQRRNRSGRRGRACDDQATISTLRER